MPSNIKHRKITILSTYPPRECGLATFTQDLITAIDETGAVETSVIAVSNSLQDVYDHKVEHSIRQFRRSDYIELAHKINDSDTDMLIIEHEYGIYGGEYGEYIVDLILNLRIPVVTTFHTVLSEPNPKQRHIIKTLTEKSEQVIVMANNTKQLLQTEYNISPEKIEVIHHGVPERVISSRQALKKKYGFDNREIISTFGLIAPGKGIEHAIMAILNVVSEHKDILYLVLGQTHPCLLKEEGEAYRDKLNRLVDQNNLNENILFINKYLTKEEIIDYLQLSDIYLTPYLGKDQAVSGTLAYAVGYGKAIVSTPYMYAKEMLSEGRGLIADFNDPDSIARCIKHILQNPDKKKIMEATTLKLGRTMYWGNIARHYVKVILNIIEEGLLKKSSVAQ
jgi:polysaccharide biosynthesis protein PslF